MARSGGKTIDTWKHEAQGVTVPIKMNAGGNFIAELNGATFHSDSIKEIRLKLKEAVELAHSLTWIPVIQIEVSGQNSDTGFDAATSSALHANLTLYTQRFWIANVADGSWLTSHVWYSTVDGETFDFKVDVKRQGAPTERMAAVQRWSPPSQSIYRLVAESSVL